ncbi:nuclease PIN [Escherichia coli]|nr:nuclease PIN [Escherichia coli]MDY9212514.1 nuclease PIN [Escherichia coli]MDY9267086.1 nuclease PIN [Escherichia coli]MDY9321869.1 nuclease PIN [Escherichia coli]MDY9326739.1 nuclease PIN [Escherichia coli]
MLHAIKYTITIFIFLFSRCVFAEYYCNILWANDRYPSIESKAVNISGYGNVSVPIRFNAGGNSTLVSRYFYSAPPFDVWVSEGSYRYWIQFPDSWRAYNGLRYRITSTLEKSAVQIPGFQTVVTPNNKHTWIGNDIFCNDIGTNYPFSPASFTGVNVEIDKNSAYPGVYNLQLPIKVAYEENKGNYSGSQGGGWHDFPSAISKLNYVTTDNFQVVVSSYCSLTTPRINFDFGNVSDRQVLSGVSKSVNIGISCSGTSTVKLTLHNTNNNMNTTNCGSATCTLTFDSGKSETNVNFTGQGYKEVRINNLLKSNNVSPGHFSAGMVLSFYVL